MNGWRPVELVFVPQFFTAREWQALRDDLHADRATPEDIAAGRGIEYEELRQFT